MRRNLLLRHLSVLGLIIGLMLVAAISQTAKTQASQGHVALLTVDGAIGPSTTDYLIHNMKEARDAGARAIVIRMDTPGGLDAATREIVQALLASPVPIITYVHPAGARAASAGTYILYASHVAAMTPSTTLGAATPVQMGGQDSGGEETSPEASQEDKDSEASGTPDTAMERKIVNDAVAFIRGLAHRHDRNADWAERAVREAVSLTAKEALQHDVIEVVATDIEDLLAQVDGMEVQLPSGPATLALDGLPVVDYAPSWRHKLLALITHPQIAYILLLVGIYGLIFEGYSPGAMVPGVIGIICLLTALYAMQVLPVNYAGLGLIIVGALLIAAEAFVPSFGILGIGGVIALVIGSLLLMDTDMPGMMISREFIVAIGAVSSLVVLGILIMVGRSLKIPRLTSSNQAMVGRMAYVAHSEDGEGQVRIDGELWRAKSEEPLQIGQRVRIKAQKGLTLTVEQVKEENNG
jgi:membrane-bound serine protease (ClpP class)